MRIPLKYKFLSVLVIIMAAGFSTFFYFARKTFSEDKKLFVMEMNLTTLSAAISEIKLELRGRLEELQILVPRIYQFSSGNEMKEEELHQGLSGRLSEEVIAVTFYHWDTEAKSYKVTHRYENTSLLSKRNLSPGALATLDRSHPLPLTSISQGDGMQLLNRSHLFREGSTQIELPILSILFNGTFLNADTKETLIAVDLVQDFLRKKLQQSELAEIFLITKNGVILSHGSLEPLIEYSRKRYPHPIVERLQSKQFPRESFEVKLNEEDYLCNVSETGFNDIFAVSQIKKSEAFQALTKLLSQTLQLALLIISIALIVSVIFASRLTSNIQKLQQAAEQIGTGQLEVKLNIDSRDEVQSVAESFQWMSSRLTELIKESAQKARMEEELATASLIQNTILTPPQIATDAAQIVPFYLPASECGGDFWDAFLQGNKLTLVLGDATGHGAPAAIVTAVAKSCISTLNSVYKQSNLTPAEFLSMLNSIIYGSCRGELLMTMCIVQLNLETGKLTLCNAGHESPLCLRANAQPDKKGKIKADTLFARGERLGFDPKATFESTEVSLDIGDTVLLYTDGISEAPNPEGKEWGERALKKVFSGTGLRPLENIRDELVSAVKAHAENAVQIDDITFVLLSWKKKVSGTQTVESLKATAHLLNDNAKELNAEGPSSLSQRIELSDPLYPCDEIRDDKSFEREEEESSESEPSSNGKTRAA